MLHVTNGDLAAELIRGSRLGGEVLAWRDVLHEGPVPADLPPAELRAVRARFIADRGWGAHGDVLGEFAARDDALDRTRDHDEVVLWFEHDLYDQLQLLQVLDRLARADAGPVRLSLAEVAGHLGSMQRDLLVASFGTRRPLSTTVLTLGRRAWEAFRASDPSAVVTFLAGDTRPLPFLSGALRRHLEEFPWTVTGLSRSEAQALSAVARGAPSLKEAFTASHHAREERIFLGDVVFAWHLERLSQGASPLIVLDDGGPIVAPRTPAAAREFWRRRAELTEAGRAVLEGEDDWIAINGIDRWLGGVHLRAGGSLWRWDAATQGLLRTA